MINNTKQNIEKLENYLKKRDEINVDIVEVFRAIALFNGVNNIKKTKDVMEAYSYLKPKKHMVFILFDGFGYEKLMSLDDNSILKQNLVRKINTVNPTSTACVLTSLISCKYPNEHGIYGWWDYNKEFNIDYFPLLFEERKTGISLDKKGIKIDDIYKFEPIFDKFKTKVNVYENIDIINSYYTKMFTKNASTHGYRSIKDCFNKLIKNLKNESINTFNYIYIDGLDLMSHIYGTDSKEVMNIIYEVEEGIKSVIKSNLDISFIVTADHGQVNMKSMLYLNQNYDYSKYFYATPSIDTRTISFFVKPEYIEEFREKFLNEFKEDVILLTKEDVETLNLFGKEKFSKIAKDSLGEFIAVIVNDKFMVCDKIEKEDKIFTKGNHSGLTYNETVVPLIII